MIRASGAWFAVCFLGAGAAMCGADTVDPHLAGPTPKLLSEYHLFADPARQIPNDRVVPYALSTPLFSDYATKHRFVWMPEGTSAVYNAHDVFDFPIGAILVKTFSYMNDMRDPAKGERLIETRLLIHKRSGWVMLPYVWNKDATDARLAIGGSIIPVNWIHSDGSRRSTHYIVPNMNDCKKCHGGNGPAIPIGPKARYLNCNFNYATGVENQLAHWTSVTYLSGLTSAKDAPKAPQWDDPAEGSVDRRARTYLDINCAHCHNPKGQAYTSGLDLSFDQTTPMRIGVHKAPVAAGRGASVGHYDIEPGVPEKSILLYRMTSTDPGVRMPVSARGLVHEEGVALIRQWIAEMPARAGTPH